MCKGAINHYRVNNWFIIIHFNKSFWPREIFIKECGSLLNFTSISLVLLISTILKTFGQCPKNQYNEKQHRHSNGKTYAIRLSSPSLIWAQKKKCITPPANHLKEKVGTYPGVCFISGSYHMTYMSFWLGCKFSKRYISFGFACLHIYRIFNDQNISSSKGNWKKRLRRNC